MPRGKPKNLPTQARIEWLEKLERDGVARREGWHMVPFHCMKLGWTSWAVPEAPGLADYGEMLTDEGRRVLADWRSS